jgi:hypothetical protein
MRLQDEAKAIAEEFLLDHEGVLRVLKKARRFGPSYPAPENDDGSLGWLLEPPSLAALCREIPPEDALAAFEEAEPWLVRRRRELLMRFVPLCPYPFYTLDELASFIDLLCRHTVDEMADSSPAPFEACAWLNSMTSAVRLSETSDGQLIEDLLDNRFAVLCELAEGLKKRQATGQRQWKRAKLIAAQTWAACLSELEQNLKEYPTLGTQLQREIEGLAAWEAAGGRNDETLSALKGGVLATMMVALHVCKEIAIGTCDRTREALGPLIGLDHAGNASLGGSALDPVFGQKTILWAKHPHGSGTEVSRALDMCCRLETVEAKFTGECAEGLVEIAITLPASLVQDGGDLADRVGRAFKDAYNALTSGKRSRTDLATEPSNEDVFAVFKGTDWGDIAMALDQTGDYVRITLKRGGSRRVHFSQLTFSDRRVTIPAEDRGKDRKGVLDSLEILKTLLRCGHYEFETASEKGKNCEKKAIEQINKKLKGKLGIQVERPVFFDRKKGRYRTRFSTGF